jgi:exoribonuclease R
MMRGRVGEEMMGTVIGVSGRGVTVRLDENLAEGYVEFNALSDGWAETHRFWVILETPTGMQKIVLGDRMEVQIADIDLASRSMRLTPLGKWARARGRGHGGRGRHENRPRESSRDRGGNRGRKGKRRR